MSRPNVANWQYLGVDKFTRWLEWNCGSKARNGPICEDTFAYGSYSCKDVDIKFIRCQFCKPLKIMITVLPYTSNHYIHSRDCMLRWLNTRTFINTLTDKRVSKHNYRGTARKTILHLLVVVVLFGRCICIVMISFQRWKCDWVLTLIFSWKCFWKNKLLQSSFCGPICSESFWEKLQNKLDCIK